MKTILALLLSLSLAGCASTLLPVFEKPKPAQDPATGSVNAELGIVTPSVVLRQVKDPSLLKAGLIVVEIISSGSLPAAISYEVEGQTGQCYPSATVCTVDVRALLSGKRVLDPSNLSVHFRVSQSALTLLIAKADLRAFVRPYLRISVEHTALFWAPNPLSISHLKAEKGDYFNASGSQSNATFIKIEKSGRELWVPRSSGEIHYLVY